MRRLVPVIIVLGLLLGGCAAFKAAFKVASPTAGGDQMIGLKGGDGDSVASWIAIMGLTSVALISYPAQRKARLAWNSWRGRSGSSGSPGPPTRSRKGREVCIKSSEWES
jgi:hypothetical protein